MKFCKIASLCLSIVISIMTKVSTKQISQNLTQLSSNKVVCLNYSIQAVDKKYHAKFSEQI